MQDEPPRRARRRLRVLVAIGLLACAAAVPLAWRLGPAPRLRKNVLFIVLDTLPASRLGCYGYTRDVGAAKVSITPNIDRLAERGTLFENCFSQSNWTVVSTASMLYSAIPVPQSKDECFDYVSRAGLNHCLFEMLGKAYLDDDYQRVAVVTNPHLLDPVYTSVFDVIANVIPHPFRETPDRLVGNDVFYGNAGDVNAAAFGSIALAKERGRAFALYLHYMDVHEPYPWRAPYRMTFKDGAAAPEPFMELIDDVAAAYEAGGRTGVYSGDIAARIERLNNDYDAALMYLDERIGNLVDFLDRERLTDETLLVLAADHGQQFGEHGGIGHVTALYSDETHVPLICVGGAFPADLRVGAVVRNLDVMPTIQDYVDVHPDADGQSLYPLAAAAARHEVVPDRKVYARSPLPPSTDPDRLCEMILIPPRLKYIRWFDLDGKVTREELYDLAADPLERRNLSESRLADLDSLRDRLESFKARQTAGGDSPRPRSVDSPIIRERLRALGYLN